MKAYSKYFREDYIMNRKYFRYSTAILGILAGITISTSMVHADTTNVPSSNNEANTEIINT